MPKLTTIVKFLMHQSMFSVRVKRFALFGKAREDAECVNLVQAWSTGSAPRISVPELFPQISACDNIHLRKPESRAVGMSLDLQELIHVISVMKHAGARRVLEIGTFDGFTTLNLAANLSDEAEVLTLDLPPERAAGSAPISNASEPGIVGSKFRGEPEEKRIRQLWADSTTSDWSVLFGSPIDMILIDGCHDYEYVRKDTANALKFIAPGGIVFWHDYGQFADVSKAVDEFAPGHSIVALKGTRLACFVRPHAN